MRNLIKKILREDDFDWIREVPPLVLSDCNWAIKVNDEKEWREAEEFLFDSGWSWFGNLEGEHSNYEPRFNYFVPDWCSEMFFDGVNIRYMLKRLPEHIIHEWSEIKGLVNESLNESDDLDWIRDVSGKIPEVNEENKFLILVNILGINEVFGDVTGFDDENTDFRQNRWDYYDIETFTLNNGEEWAVGTPEEFDTALYDYWWNFVDDVGLDSIDEIESYLTMSDTDRRLFAQESSDNYVEDLTDEEVLIVADLESEWEELGEQIEELEDQRDGIDTSIDDKISDLESERESLVYRAREDVRESYYEEWYDCLADPYRCLVREHGYYMGPKDLVDSGLVYFDEEAFARDMADRSDWGLLSRYDSDYHEDSGYVAIRLN
jgi:hypothetical protein